MLREDKRVKMSRLQLVKQYIKVNRNSTSMRIRCMVRSLYAVKKVLAWMKSFIFSREFRSILYLKLFENQRLQQTTPLTSMNRYPVIFTGCCRYVEDRENLKILSYGCSTGEEVLTLRHYFPSATIVGAEINQNSLRVCRELRVDENIKFIKSIPSTIEEEGPFDVIFCMAVLQRTPGWVTDQGITSLKKIYPFEKFEKQVLELDSYLKLEGLMVIHFSQYNFTDTSVSSNYQPLVGYNQDEYNAAIFDKSSCLIKERKLRHSIFIKNSLNL